MNDENKIQDAQIERIEDVSSVKINTETIEVKSKLRIDLYIELVLFLILGILVGIAIKTEAVKRITMGYDDYKMAIFQGGYDINKLELEQMQKRNQQAEAGGDGSQAQAAASQGGSCQN